MLLKYGKQYALDLYATMTANKPQYTLKSHSADVVLCMGKAVYGSV